MAYIKEISKGADIYDIKVKNDHALKSYLDDGTLLTDTEGLADVTSYVHSTFDLGKFTVVGSPTISSDGVASGFSNSNYLTHNINLSNYNSFKINGNFYVDDFQTNQIMLGTYPNVFGLYLTVYTPCYGSFELYKDDIYIGKINFDYNIGVHYFYEIIFTGTEYKLYLGENKTNLPLIGSVISSTHITSAEKISIGQCVGQYLNGSIDLKQFSITVDGVPVFSGNKTGIDTYTINGNTVSVPYTLSKTGSKIVDSYYRTQVTSVYNAFGYAPYYTLNEGTNFTLPMGEIYGFIGKNDVIEYVNGTSGYRIWVKTGYCEQWGRFNVGAAQSASTTFTKTFNDTNYYLNVTDGITTTGWGGAETNCYIYSMATTGFTFQSGYGDRTVNIMWKASGYLTNGQW